MLCWKVALPTTVSMLYYFMFQALPSTTALVIKASPLYILKQMPHVSNCFIFSSQCLRKKKSFELQNLQSVHTTVWPFTIRCLNTTPLLLSPIIDPYDHYILFFDLSITYTYLDYLVVGPNWSLNGHNLIRGNQSLLSISAIGILQSLNK